MGYGCRRGPSICSQHDGCFFRQAAYVEGLERIAEGYYDDSDDTVVDAAIAGTTGTIILYPTRANMTNYWYGTAFLVSVEQTITSEDYSELNCDAEGSGALTWINN